MQFQIAKVILWPRKELPPRVLPFEEGKVNVISGASKTGKSAVIPVIDYCLGSDKCAIPVGVIREQCSWFGIVVKTVEGEKLFARREPGNQKQTGDMYVLEDEIVEIPESAPEKNSNTDQAKEILNRLSGLSSLGLSPGSEGYSSARTSFRDLMAFTFQPQNVVANPDVLYFKADTTEHREKLKAIFPYVLNAVTQEIMVARWERDRLKKILDRKLNALESAKSEVEVWMAEASGWVNQARELGLIEVNVKTPPEWPELLALLKEISATSYRDAKTSLPAIDQVLEAVADLRQSESEEAVALSGHRQRLWEIDRLITGSSAYGDALLIQRDRLSVSKWIRALSEDKNDPLSSISPQDSDQIDRLCTALNGLEIQIQSQPTVSDKLEKEQLRLRDLTEKSTSKLINIRAEIVRLERNSAEAKAQLFKADSIERYLGRLEQAIKLYDRAGQDAQLSTEVAELEGQIDMLGQGISESKIRADIRRALSAIQEIASTIVPKLDAEWPEASIELLIDDLTLKVIQPDRDDYLWEIGSGANWLAYHVAVTLAFQRFFQMTEAHPVPNFLIYDQPSQVYFPQSPTEESRVDGEWLDQDIEAVRKVFTAVSDEVTLADGNLQVILLDHADQKVWGNIANVSLAEDWRGDKKLIPAHWFDE